MSEALWTPSPERVVKANMTEFLRYVEERGKLVDLSSS